MVGLNFLTLIPEPYQEPVQEHLGSFSPAEPMKTIEHEVLAADGEIRWQEWRNRAFFDGQGRIVEFQSVGRDVTARVQAEQALQRRDAILEAVAWAAERFLTDPSWEDHIPETLARLGDATDVSRAYIFQNHVATDGELLASQRHEWVAADVEPQAGNPDLGDFPWGRGGMGRWAALMKRGEPVYGAVTDFPASEQDILLPQGIRSIVAAPILVASEWWGFVGLGHCTAERTWTLPEIDALKVAAGIIGTAIDRDRMTDVLGASEERFRSVVESAPSLLVIANADGNSVYVSPNCEEITGYTQEEFVGRPVWWFLEHDTALTAMVRRHAFEHAMSGRHYHFEATKKNGDVWYGSSSWEPIRGSDRQEQGVVVQTIDVTKMRRAQQALQQAHDELEQRVEERTKELTEANEALSRSEVQYRRLVERAPVIVYTSSSKRGGLYYSSRVEPLLGYSPRQLVDHPTLWRDNIHPDDLSRLREA